MKRRSKRKRSSSRPGKSSGRHFSFGFLLAIPGNFVLGGICLLTFVALAENYLFERKLWAIFLTGAVGAGVLVGMAKIPRTRTFIHELKHAVMVILSGNRIREFHVDKHTGHVQFAMYSNRVHFAPIITLAPYFLPLFSFPVLIACIALQEMYKTLLALLLGFAFSADLCFSFQELHPHQSDLRKVSGGFVASAVYLAGFHFMWTTATLLWVLGGRRAYLYAGNVTFTLIKRIAAQIEPYLY